jgi:branched-chain amino acid transport system substrate-binding protein
MRNAKIRIPLMAAMAASLIISSCGKQAAQNEILIGEYSSLTGTTATFGQSIHHGLLMAVDDINNSGGLFGKKIKLITEDDQSKPEEAAMAVTKLISRDRVVAVVGEAASSRSLAAAPICQANRIPMVSPASTNPEVTKKGDYIFRVCYIDPFQGEIMARFAFNSLKLKKVAILKDVKNDYSVGLAQYFEETFTKLGGEVIMSQAFSEGDADFKAQLTAIKAANPEAVVVPGYYTEVALIVKQGRELNMTMPFLGGDGWDSEKLLEIGGAAMNGTYFCTHYSADDPNPAVQAFVAKYNKTYTGTPDALVVLGYDAGALLFDAIKRAGAAEPEKIREALAATKDFLGISGSITIDAQRNARKSTVIIQIIDGKMKYKETIQP